MQPPDLKDILKEAIRVLHRDCAFKHGYIPVDLQMDCLVRILVEAATKLNRGDYTLRAQTDAILQRMACDLLITRVSLYQTNIKCIASSYVAHRYGLKDSKTERDVQVASLLTNDKFIFEPQEDVHASLDEKISDIKFSADTYKDSYNIYIATMEEIWAKNPAAYHRLMSDLYKLAS
ncbi:hypothetical protein EI94DRAFT_1816484 [Lactarius quietus]|nr:hypothetical protein EI94DRAFT_1816484 [Lactarius quietus]